MPERRRQMIRHLQRLDEISPLGYVVGVHIRFATPLFTKSTFPQEWQDVYAKNSYALRDPMVFWGISQSGTTRWSEITLPDPFGIMQKAAGYGLKYGATISHGKITSRTLVGISRDDREFDDAEIAEAAGIAKILHELAEPPKTLTPGLIEALRLVNEGTYPGAAAARMGITEDAFVARLTSAQRKLGASTMAEALRIARESKLI